MLTILIADDHPILRRGIVYMIKTRFMGCNIIEVSDGKAALESILFQKPDMAIIDIDMPSIKGLEVCRRAIKTGTTAKLVILTMHNQEHILNEALEIGVDGFMLKDNAIGEIEICINDVLNGKKYVSSSDKFINKTEPKKQPSSTENLLSVLTPTEYKILQHIAIGKTSRQIADMHFISLRTVDNHRANICKKLDLKGNNTLLMFAMAHAHLLKP